jgi:hypothetical protein
MRIFFLLTVLGIGSRAVYAQGSSSSVEWGHPISFEDFEATPLRSDTAAANISVTILLGYSNTPKGSLSFRVVAVMEKNESWIKDEFRRHHILKHEQGHFDIAHIYAKRLETTLRQKRYSENDIAALTTLYDQFLEEMNVLQIRYDRETKGGWDALAQSKWRRFIEGELRGVDGAYTSSKIGIRSLYGLCNVSKMSLKGRCEGGF